MRRNDVSVQTALHQLLKLIDEPHVGARMVESDDRAVLQVMQPSLGRQIEVLAKRCPSVKIAQLTSFSIRDADEHLSQRPMVPERWDSLFVRYCLVHALMNWRVKLWHVVHGMYWLYVVVRLVGLLEARVNQGMLEAMRIEVCREICLQEKLIEVTFEEVSLQLSVPRHRRSLCLECP